MKILLHNRAIVMHQYFNIKFTRSKWYQSFRFAGPHLKIFSKRHDFSLSNLGVCEKSLKFMITVFLHNYVQTYSNQVHTQNLTYNYTIIIHTNLNINLNWSPDIQISETTFFTFMKKVKRFYEKSKALLSKK